MRNIYHRTMPLKNYVEHSQSVEKTYFISQVSLTVPRTAHLNGREKTCPPQSIGSFLLYNLHLPPVSHGKPKKKQSDTSSLRPDPRLCQTVAGLSP